MELHELNLMYNLQCIINEDSYETNDYNIAMYLLANMNSIHDINVNHIVDKCFVSHSAIRRFCNRIGYENYRHLKYFLSQSTQMETFAKDFLAEEKHYQVYLKKEIQKCLDETDGSISMQSIEKVVDLIHTSNRTIFITSYTSTMLATEFQKSLLMYGKVVHVVSKINNVSEVLEHTNDNDAIILLSGTGMQAYAMLEQMKLGKAQKVLFTFIKDIQFENIYNIVLYLNNEIRTKEYVNVVGKYILQYWLDVILGNYISKYVK